MKLLEVIKIEKREYKFNGDHGVESCIGYNQCREELAGYEFDRERLAKEMYELRCKIAGGKGFQPWSVIVEDKAHPVYWVCLEDADKILQSMPSILIKKG